MDIYSSTAVIFSLSVFLLQIGQGEHTETTTEGIGTIPTTDEVDDTDVYTGWSSAAPLNTDVWDAVPTADVTDSPTHKTDATSSPGPATRNKTKSTQSTDLSDIHFQPKHKIDFDKSVFHQEAPPDNFDTNALEQFIKGDPMEPLQHEGSHRKHSSISPSPYSLSHPSRTSKHSRISEGSASHANGSRNLLHETTDPQSTDVTDKSEINESIQRGNTQDSDLGKGYTSSLQEEDAVTDTAKTLQETNLDASKNEHKTNEENSVEKDRINKLKSQVHSITQDDDGEYEYGEQVLDEVDMYTDNDEVTQGNTVDTNNQTSVKDDSSMDEIEQVDDARSNETPGGNKSKNDEKLQDSEKVDGDNNDEDGDGTDWYYSDDDDNNTDEEYEEGEEYYTDEDYDDDEDSQESSVKTGGQEKWIPPKEQERHIPVKTDTAYTSVLEDPGPLGEIKTLTHGESLTRHQPVPKQSGHDSSLPILVFYTWIGVVTVMIIGAFIALKQRHRISNFVWDHRTGYRKSETVFATEEGRNLLLHQHV